MRCCCEPNCPAKNTKGDLPTILLTPEEGGFDPQSLAMTRSIGDLYMQSFGVSWEPEVIAVDLQEECTELSHLTLIMASDGLWDVLGSQEAVDIVGKHLSLDASSGAQLSPAASADAARADCTGDASSPAQRASEELLHRALERWADQGGADSPSMGPWQSNGFPWQWERFELRQV